MAIPTTRPGETAEAPATAADAPRTPRSHGYCSWHQGHARGTRLVRLAADDASGQEHGDHFACPPCRIAYDLVSQADQT
jgi:hypothetical protein